MKIQVVDRHGVVIDTYYDVEPEDADSILYWLSIKTWLRRTLRHGRS